MVNLLDAARRLPSLRAIVVITSDKCYLRPDRRCAEGDQLGGHDPYSASKACAEIVVQAYRSCYFSPDAGVGVATVRAGNVIGGGDFSPGRLIPDLVRAFAAGVPAELRHPGGVRPWQHVLDALAGYLLLAERLAANPASFSTAWNFGPDEDEELDRGQDRRGRGRALRWRRLAVGGERSRARGADPAPLLRAGPPLARLADAADDGAGDRVGDRRLSGNAARA